jgi:ABC-type transport system involved in multi-copper enzyme maturation permease subunit
MVRKLVAVLAWTAFVAAMSFVILSLSALFAWDSLGETAPALVWYGAVPLLALAILLAVSIMIVAAFDKSPEDTK